MKKINFLLLALLLSFITYKSTAQANPFIGVLPANSGIVAVGQNLDLTITIGNTGLSSIALSKLRPNIQVPVSVTFLPDAQQTGLPAGFTILSNSGSQLRFCNSGVVIPGQTNFEIILKVQGVSVAPPTQFQGNINFGNGTTCAAGTSVSGDILADNAAQSTIEVIAAPLPLTLLSFNVTPVKCESLLNWVTESEINTDRFEIERSAFNSSDWKMIGSVKSVGSSTTKNNYSFTDNANTVSKGKIFYRLKMIDKDGVYRYSPIVILNKNCTNSTVNVYPNPVKNGKLYVTVTGMKENSLATLFSATGQLILQTRIVNGTNYINVSALSKGIYFLNVLNENSDISKVKVIVAN